MFSPHIYYNIPLIQLEANQEINQNGEYQIYDYEKDNDLDIKSHVAPAANVRNLVMSRDVVVDDPTYKNIGTFTVNVQPNLYTGYNSNNKLKLYTNINGTINIPTGYDGLGSIEYEIIQSNIWKITGDSGNGNNCTFVSGNSSDVDNIIIDFNNRSLCSSGLYKVNGSNTIFKSIIQVINNSLTTKISYLFYYCSELVSIILFDTSSVTDMEGVFEGCSALTSIPLYDTSSITSTYRMFRYCSSLISVPLFDTSKVSNMLRMFEGCTALVSVPLFDTSKVSNMGLMFDGCSSLSNESLNNILKMCTNSIVVSSTKKLNTHIDVYY